MLRPQPAVPGTTASERPAQLGVLKDCPRLVEHLCDETWDDGSARERSTLSLFLEGGMFKLSLNDRETGASMIVSGDSLQEAFKAIEKRLAGERPADWRKWKRDKRK